VQSMPLLRSTSCRNAALALNRLAQVPTHASTLPSSRAADVFLTSSASAALAALMLLQIEGWSASYIASGLLILLSQPAGICHQWTDLRRRAAALLPGVLSLPSDMLCTLVEQDVFLQLLQASICCPMCPLLWSQTTNQLVRMMHNHLQHL
jgi:hypothetical protein